MVLYPATVKDVVYITIEMSAYLIEFGQKFSFNRHVVLIYYGNTVEARAAKRAFSILRNCQIRFIKS